MGSTMLARAVGDPLVQLLIGGALIFGLYAALGGGEEAGTSAEPAAQARPVDRTIVVDAPRRAALARQFRKRFKREPSDADLKLMVDRWVNDEMLFREAQALHLGEGDSVVRSRMIQKMRTALQGTAAPEPGPSEVEAYYKAHQKDYRREATTTFRHVFVDAADAALLAGLKSGTVSAERAGKPFARGPIFRGHSEKKLRAIFGAAFVKALAGAGEKMWAGPLTSTFGVHYVWVQAREPAGTLLLGRIRKRVLNDIMQQRTRQPGGLDAKFRVEHR